MKIIVVQDVMVDNNTQPMHLIITNSNKNKIRLDNLYSTIRWVPAAHFGHVNDDFIVSAVGHEYRDAIHN